MKYKWMWGWVLCLISSSVWAAFCSSSQGNNWIDLGMSEQEVQAACGQPTAIQVSDDRSKQLKSTQYWTYQTQKASPLYPPKAPLSNGVDQLTVGSDSLTVQINQNQVSQLAMNGHLLKEASCPQGGALSLGDSADRVLALCGRPNVVSTQHEEVDVAGPQTKNWVYSSGQGQSSLQIEFSDGVVSKID